MKLVVFRSLGKSDLVTSGSGTVISARSSTSARAAEVSTSSPLKRVSACVVNIIISDAQILELITVKVFIVHVHRTLDLSSMNGLLSQLETSVSPHVELS